MIAYFGKCLLLVTIMFLGVLFGMQQANHGMLSMKGYHDPSLKGRLRSPTEKIMKKKPQS